MRYYVSSILREAQNIQPNMMNLAKASHSSTSVIDPGAANPSPDDNRDDGCLLVSR
jgi:hypothetical protein